MTWCCCNFHQNSAQQSAAFTGAASWSWLFSIILHSVITLEGWLINRNRRLRSKKCTQLVRTRNNKCEKLCSYLQWDYTQVITSVYTARAAHNMSAIVYDSRLAQTKTKHSCNANQDRQVQTNQQLQTLCKSSTIHVLYRLNEHEIRMAHKTALGSKLHGMYKLPGPMPKTVLSH